MVQFAKGNLPGMPRLPHPKRILLEKYHTRGAPHTQTAPLPEAEEPKADILSPTF